MNTLIAVAPAEQTSDKHQPAHIACCLPDPGETSPALCGMVEIVDEDYIEDVPPEDWCVVCTDLDKQDTCPILGRCPYGDDWGKR